MFFLNFRCQILWI